MQYYYADGDQQKGPVELDRLKTAGISADTLVWRDGLSEWQPAGKVPELASIFAKSAVAAAQPQPSVHSQSYPQPQGYAQQSPGSAPGNSPSAGYQQGAYAPVGYPQPGMPQEIGYGTPYAAPPSQGMSIASMILGILAIPSTFCYGSGLVLAILAIIFGHIGHSQSKRQTGQANGMALAGLICGYISLGIVLVVILFVFILAAGFAAAGQ